MILKDLWNLFEEKVFPIPSTNDLFNQYKDRELTVDLPNAHKIRRENLMSYLRSFAERPFVLIVGEAPGPWGCRFSGVPFTSETQLCRQFDLPFSGCQSSTSKAPYSSITSKIFWKIMLHHHPKIFVWNCVPFHPHKSNEMLSVRNPRTKEVLYYSKILKEIISLIEPMYIVAIGRNAEHSLRKLGFSPIYVRHPSHGGINRFKGDIERFFNEV